ncbi:uncharacterized protein LOC134776847 [Penaeus indicus]|uniref:uncharacterized protein LOC134776847 n=1 Tax=Penaeus indicus TaxID=29960 RepID=UPI00300D8A31
MRWQIGMESKGLKVNTKKTEVMASSRRDVEVNSKYKDNARLKQVRVFKYLGVTVDARGGSQVAMRAKVAAAWNKWKELSDVISDRMMPRKLKVKLYSSIIRPVLLYGAEVWRMRKEEERILEATERRMLRRIKGVTLRERSTDIRRELGVSDTNDKVKEIRMRWYGHVKRREGHPAKVAMESIVPGRGPRGRPKKRCRDNVKEDMSHFGVRPEEALERETWRRKIRAADPARRDQQPQHPASKHEITQRESKEFSLEDITLVVSDHNAGYKERTQRLANLAREELNASQVNSNQPPSPIPRPHFSPNQPRDTLFSFSHAHLSITHICLVF